jgi:hypothetical protein
MEQTVKSGARWLKPAICCVVVILILGIVLHVWLWWYNRQPRRLVQPNPSGWSFPASDEIARAVKAIASDWQRYARTAVQTVPVPPRPQAIAVFDFQLEGSVPPQTVRVVDWMALAEELLGFFASPGPRWWIWSAHGRAGRFDPNNNRTSTLPELDRIGVNEFLSAYRAWLNGGTLPDAPPNGQQLSAMMTALACARIHLRGGVLELYVCHFGEDQGAAMKLAYCLPGTTVIVYQWRVFWVFGKQVCLFSPTAYKRPDAANP